MRRSQASMEYILVIAIAFILIVPLVYIFYSYSQSSTESINLARLNTLGRTIVTNAESIYYLGEPSKITISQTFPEGITYLGINSSDIDNIYELVFTLEDGSTVPFSSNVKIDADFTAASYSPGKKTISIESKGTYVFLNIT